MKKLMKLNKNTFLFFCLLFCLFLIWNLFLTPICLDEVWNYGFSNNIYHGLIPYRDFNMVVTPFYPMFMSLFFYIFGSSSLVMHVVNALMLTFFSFLLTKIIKEKTWIVVFFFFYFMQVTFPGYNIFLVMLFILLCYLEENKKNDYLIGIVLAITILTKQSVGFCMLFPSLYYFRDKNKLLKRFVGFIGPCLLFLVYLLITKSLYQFLDLCLFGLFDFASANGEEFNIYWIFLIVMASILIYFIFKDMSNIKNYYGLAFLSVGVPLFDKYHTVVAFYCFLIVFLSNLKLSFKFNVNGKLIISCVLIGMCFIVGSQVLENVKYPNDINHFEYRKLDDYTIGFTKEMNEFISDNNNRKLIFLNSNGYYFKIVNDMEISYVDLINDGNWGYNGSEKLFKKVTSVDDAIYIVDPNELDEVYQINKNVINYVLENGKKIKSIRTYDIYVIE